MIQKFIQLRVDSPVAEMVSSCMEQDQLEAVMSPSRLTPAQNGG